MIDKTKEKTITFNITQKKGSNRYKDYNYLSAFKTIYGNKLLRSRF